MGSQQRPSIERVKEITFWEPDALGHVWVSGDGWFYPCRGCGAERNTGLALVACLRPYQDPVAITALLVEIRGLLRELVAQGAAR